MGKFPHFCSSKPSFCRSNLYILDAMKRNLYLGMGQAVGLSWRTAASCCFQMRNLSDTRSPRIKLPHNISAGFTFKISYFIFRSACWSPGESDSVVNPPHQVLTVGGATALVEPTLRDQPISSTCLIIPGYLQHPGWEIYRWANYFGDSWKCQLSASWHQLCFLLEEMWSDWSVLKAFVCAAGLLITSFHISLFWECSSLNWSTSCSLYMSPEYANKMLNTSAVASSTDGQGKFVLHKH